MKVDVDVFGDKELSIALQGLSAKAQDKIIRPAVNKALTPLNKAAKRNCPKETGALRSSIGKKVKKYKNIGVIWGAVGVRSGSKFIRYDEKGRKRNPIKYAHLVEFGHGGKKPAPPHPFLRPAFDSTKSQMWNILVNTTKQRLLDEVAGLKRRRAK